MAYDPYLALLNYSPSTPIFYYPLGVAPSLPFDVATFVFVDSSVIASPPLTFIEGPTAIAPFGVSYQASITLIYYGTASSYSVPAWAVGQPSKDGLQLIAAGIFDEPLIFFSKGQQITLKVGGQLQVQNTAAT